MVARLVGRLACLCFAATTATEPQTRKFSDEEVSGTQRYFSEALREHLNTGQTDYCDTAYLEDASMQVSLGPIATDPVIVKMGLHDPAVFRGRANITGFWRTLHEKGKVKDLKAYDDKGEYAASSFVIDDDTLILETPFANNKFQGHIFSETWVRVDKEWKLRSQMIRVQKKLSDLGEPPATTTEEKKGWLPGFLGGSSEKTEEATTTAAPTSESTETTEAHKDTEEPPAEQLTQTEAQEPPSSGRGKTFWLMIGLTVMAAAGFLVRHHKMRQDQRQIARFDSMLG